MSIQEINYNNTITLHKINSKESDTDKTDGIANRILKSPLFWSSAAIIVLITFTAIVLTGLIGVSAIVLAPVLGFGLLALGLAIYKYRSKLFYEITLLGVIVANALGQPWYHTIDKDKVVFGAIPLRNKHHIELLQKENIGAILSLLNDFEFRHETLFSVPVKKSEWKKRKIEQLHLKVSDLGPPSQSQIRKGVKFIEDKIAEGKKVYVHCKAGQGRSATFVVCYLLKHNPLDLVVKSDRTLAESVIEYVGNIRSIQISASQKKAIEVFASTFNIK
jgi:atypical dual specificity phosphatase